MMKLVAVAFALFHFLVTEMRSIWLLEFIVYNTFASTVTSSAITDAFDNQDVAKCIHHGRIKARDVEDCAKSAYERYLYYGPQHPFKNCSDECPGSGVGIRAPEARILFFITTGWLSGMYRYLVT